MFNLQNEITLTLTNDITQQMNNKKAQITIFLILGVVVLIAVGFILYITNISKKASFKSEEPSNIISVKDSAEFFTQTCLNNVLKEALNKLGENGGYIYRTPNLKIQYTQDYMFTFLYIDRTNFLPSLDIIKSDIEKYINENLRYCLDDFVIYEKQGWNIEIPEIKSKATLTENDVIAELEFPVKFTRNKASFSLDKFFVRNQISIKKILQEAGNILKEAEDAQQKIDRRKSPSIPPQSFTRNGLLFLNYQYPDTGRFLWLIKEKEYEFFFAVNLET